MAKYNLQFVSMSRKMWGETKEFDSDNSLSDYLYEKINKKNNKLIGIFKED